MITVRKLTAAVAAVVVLSLYLTAPAAVADDRCPASASVCHYRLPSSVTNARNACYGAEADSRGIPRGDAAYRAWWAAASSSTRAEWTRAFNRCQDRNQLPGGKWAWGSMIFIGSN